MVEKHKHYVVIKYCIGWNFDGPIYAVHTLNYEKIPKPKPLKTKIPIVKGWRVLNTAYKHEHNH